MTGIVRSTAFGDGRFNLDLPGCMPASHAWKDLTEHRPDSIVFQIRMLNRGVQFSPDNPSWRRGRPGDSDISQTSSNGSDLQASEMRLTLLNSPLHGQNQPVSVLISRCMKAEFLQQNFSLDRDLRPGSGRREVQLLLSRSPSLRSGGGKGQLAEVSEAVCRAQT